MRDLISKGLLTAAAASSVLSLSGGYAQAADASGTAVGSPGLLSGNNVQAPLDIPVNVCGNSVDVIGLLNPAFGNTCANVSHPPKHHTDQRHPAPHHPAAPPQHAPQQHDAPQYGAPAQPHAPQPHTAPGAPHQAVTGSGSEASSIAKGSPGVLGGNDVETPVDLPVNVCGDSADLVGLLNPAFGNTCVNGTPPERPTAPELPDTPDEEPEEPEEPEEITPPDDRSVVPPAHAGPPHHVPHTETASRAITPAVLPAVLPAAAAPEADARLAATGGDPRLLAAAASSAGLILGGALLYRRSRVPARV
ncbi:chaplin [Streptomyces sp. NPDC059092]|uniref:chaplin n=1 Tax=Streptomyces sp. NPDC059092 TaxID=3346725 RepID=UPI0036AA862D